MKREGERMTREGEKMRKEGERTAWSGVEFVRGLVAPVRGTAAPSSVTCSRNVFFVNFKINVWRETMGYTGGNFAQGLVTHPDEDGPLFTQASLLSLVSGCFSSVFYSRSERESERGGSVANTRAENGSSRSNSASYRFGMGRA